MNKTAQISLSEENLDCNGVVAALLECKIMGSVTKNVTITCKKNKCNIEKGCRIITGDIQDKNRLKNLWTKLKKENNLTCAHIKTELNFQGCVYDFLKESACPD